jgi:DNA-binding response OmpR family regulator
MKSVLVIDDEPQMAKLVEMTLVDMDVRVVQAVNSREGLKALENEQPACVLLDIALKRENGMSLLRELKQLGSMSETPVIMFSVHDSMRSEALALGADGFISKPFSTTELRSELEPHLK